MAPPFPILWITGVWASIEAKLLSVFKEEKNQEMCLFVPEEILNKASGSICFFVQVCVYQNFNCNL